MEARRFKRHLDSDSLHIAGLKEMIHKDVEVIVLVEADAEPADVAASAGLPKRRPGSAKGLVSITDDFPRPLAEDAAAEFYQ